jgi:outer membrane protein assembly factor BamA
MKLSRISFIFCLLVISKFSLAQADSLTAVQPVADSIRVADSIKDNDTSTVFIANISIYGNNKTKDFIILREIPFKQGDNVSKKDLPKKLVIAKDQLINTSLFLDVSVYVQATYGDFVFITVYVKERWYIFPLPYFSLVDKNINTWWVTYNHSLKRANYGIKFLHNNISGRNDKLMLWLITGYTRQVSLKYIRPFFDAKLHNGYNVSFNYTKQRELNYATSFSKQQFFKPDSSFFVRDGIEAEVDYVYRPALRTRHVFTLGFNTEHVSDTILKFNPHYLPDGKTKVAFPVIGYTLAYSHADYNWYPTKGFLGQASISYHGGFNSGINLTQLQLEGSYTIPLLPKTQIQFKEGAMLSLPFNQPFYTKKLFGYGGMFMRGYEYYVMDGVAGTISRATLQHKLLHLNFKLASGNHSLNVPLTFYGKVYADAGYVYDKQPENSLLNNKLIHSWGFGVDMISFYDIIFKFDYTINQLGESGLFIHVRTDF